MSSPVAYVEIQARARGLAAQLREVSAEFSKFAGGVTSKSHSMWGELGKGAKGIGSAVWQGIGQGVGQRLFSQVEDGAKEVIDLDRALTKFGISARKSPAELEAVREGVLKLSRETGTSATAIIKGRQALVDLAGAGADSDATMKTIVKTSKATGAEMSDIVTVAYSLQDALKLDPKDLEATLSGLVNQSKDGAVHFNQMAGEIIGIAPRFARFGVLGREGANQLGAMFQVTRTGFKDASETATGMEGIFKGLVLHADRFRHAGVQIYTTGRDGVKHMRPLEQIFAEINKSALAKDPTLLAKAFGRGEGEQAFRMLSTHLDLYKQLIASGQDATTIDKDYATVMQSASAKLDKAWNDIKVSVAEALTPERIQKFVAALEVAVGVLGKMIGFTQELTGSIQAPELQSEKLVDKLAVLAGGGDAMSKRLLEQTLGHEVGDEELKHRAAAGRTNLAKVASENRWAMNEWKNQNSADSWAAKPLEGPSRIEPGADLAKAVEPLARYLAEIAKNTGTGTTVQVGADAIAHASKSAAANRRGAAR